MDSIGRGKHLRNYERNHPTNKKTYDESEQHKYNYQRRQYPETYEESQPRFQQRKFNYNRRQYPETYNKGRQRDFNYERIPYPKSYEEPQQYQGQYGESQQYKRQYSGQYEEPQQYPEQYEELEQYPGQYEEAAQYPEQYEEPQQYPETYDDSQSRIQQNGYNFKRRQYPEKQKLKLLSQQREFKKRPYPKKNKGKQATLRRDSDIPKPRLQHKTMKKGQASFRNEKMKVIESCETVVKKINEIENNNTADNISQQKNENELSQNPRYLKEMDDSRNIKLKINGINGDINIQNQNSASKHNKCSEKLSETKNSESISRDKKDIFLEKGSLICKINRSSLGDNLIQSASGKELYKNKRETETQKNENGSETTIKDQSKRIKLEQENSKEISNTNENIKSVILSPSIKTDKEDNNIDLTKNNNLLNKDSELKVNLDSTKKEENLNKVIEKESVVTEKSTNDNNLININKDCSATNNSLVNINKDCSNSDNERDDLKTQAKVDCTKTQTEVDCTKTQTEEDCTKTQTEEDCAKTQTEEDCTKIQTEEDCTKIQTEEDCTNIQTEEDCTKIQTKEDCLKIRTEEDCLKIRTEEDCLKIRTEEDCVKTRTEEDCAKTRTEEDYVKTRTEEDCVKTRTEEDCVKTRTEEDCTKTQTEEDCAKIQTREDCTKTQTEEVCAKIQTGEDSKKIQTEEVCAKTMSGEECIKTVGDSINSQTKKDCLKTQSEEKCVKIQTEKVCIKTQTNEVCINIDSEETGNNSKRLRYVSFDSDDDDEPSIKKIILSNVNNNNDNELTPKDLDNNKKEDLDKVIEKKSKFSEYYTLHKQEENIESRNEDIIEVDNENESKISTSIEEDTKDSEIKEDIDIILINDEPKDFLLKEKRTSLPGLQKFITEQKPILTKKDLNDIIIQQFCNIINSKSDLGQTRAKCHFLEQSNKKLKAQLESVNKQVGHLQSALQKLSAQTEGKDKPPMPLKLVRSVAIQIGRSRASLGNQHNIEQTQSGPSNLSNKAKQNVNTNSINSPVPVNNTPIVQRTPNVLLPRSSSTSSLPTQDISKVITPPVKGIRTLLPRTNIPKTTVDSRLQPQKPLPMLTASPKVLPTGFKPKTPPILTPNLPSNPNITNRPKPTSVKIASEPPKLTLKTNNNVIDIDLTDEDEAPNKKNQPPPTRPLLNKAINRKMPLTTALVPTVNNTLQTVKTAPQVAWNNLMPQKGNEIRLISNGGIRLPNAQKGVSYVLAPASNMPTNLLMTTSNSSNDMTNQTTYILKNGKLINAQLAHPAPLPQQPIPAQNPSWLAPPPKPDLQISRVNAKTPNGIVLSWMMSLTRDFAEIVSYQLYAYEETHGIIPSTSLWKKVGDVKALPLPMACTLTQFVVGHKYHFAVRAVDVHARIGPFSMPGSIVLVGK